MPFLVVKAEGRDAELPRATSLGFRDFFTSLFANHPAAGRPRSVFGGLWTDRTDTTSLLRGKLATGQISPSVEVPIRRLISNGFAIVTLRKPPRPADWKSHKARWVGDALEDEELLPVLQAALEDIHLAVGATYSDTTANSLAQPSNENPSPSSAECLEIVIPLEGDVRIDVVRDSHLLPEFTLHGVSRWASRAGSDGRSVAGVNGLLETQNVPQGSAAVIGAGVYFGHVASQVLGA